MDGWMDDEYAVHDRAPDKVSEKNHFCGVVCIITSLFIKIAYGYMTLRDFTHRNYRLLFLHNPLPPALPPQPNVMDPRMFLD